MPDTRPANSSQGEMSLKWSKKTNKACFSCAIFCPNTNLDRRHRLRFSCHCVKNCLNTEASLYTILQILSLTLFEKTRIDQLLQNTEDLFENAKIDNQMNELN
jgi:hypothetical protein